MKTIHILNINKIVEAALHYARVVENNPYGKHEIKQALNAFNRAVDAVDVDDDLKKELKDPEIWYGNCFANLVKLGWTIDIDKTQASDYMQQQHMLIVYDAICVKHRQVKQCTDCIRFHECADKGNFKFEGNKVVQKVRVISDDDQ